MNPRAGVILQARMASTRLPGKALATIAGRPILQHCLRRLLRAGVNRVVLATTVRPEDDILADMASRSGVAVHRGSADDVLARFAEAAERYEIDPVLRATADNPAVDPHAAGRLIARLRLTGADYAHETGLPLGAGLEAMTGAALQYAASAAPAGEDREHVTTYIKNNPHIFRIDASPAPSALASAGLRLTVDTSDDLEWLRALFAGAGSPDPSVEDLVQIAARVRQEVA